jgi:CheY-like chemotaxis protein
MNVLIVDDDPSQLRLWSLILGAAGHEVRTAASRGEAQAELSGRAPDVLLMDLRMPRAEDGFALIRAAAGCAGKILVLSGWPEDLDGRPEAGQVARVLLKPIRTAELLAAVGSYS